MEFDTFFRFHDDIVALAQLWRGDVCLFEQEINPVELVNWCVAEVGKRSKENHIIRLVGTPNQTVLINGDLSKLKQLLVKFFTSAIHQLQIDGANVQAKIFVDTKGYLTISVKLGDV